MEVYTLEAGEYTHDWNISKSAWLFFWVFEQRLVSCTKNTDSQVYDLIW